MSSRGRQTLNVEDAEEENLTSADKRLVDVDVDSSAWWVGYNVRRRGEVRQTSKSCCWCLLSGGAAAAAANPWT